MDPMTAMMVIQGGIAAGKAVQQGVNKQILNAGSSGANVNAPKKEMQKSKTITFNDPNKKFDMNNYSRPMTSGTSSIEPAVDSNYNQKYNDLTMGPIDNTSVPENESIDRGNIFNQNVQTT